MDWLKFEIVSLVLTALCFTIYHGVLFWLILNKPLSTSAGQNDVIRRAWVRLVMEERKDILAVQTLRNVMMSSSLLATTALTLSSLLAAFFIKGGDEGSKLADMSQNLSDHFTVEHKLFVMIVLFMLSFFSYMQSVRINSHAGFMFGIPANGSFSQKPEFLTEEYMSKLLFRGNIYHTIGTRFFYFSFLTVLWLFGPLMSSIASALLLIILYVADYPISANASKITVE